MGVGRVSASAVLRIDPSNVEQAKAWDGDEGEYWATYPERFDRSIARYHGPFLGAATIGPTDDVLDIGCGTGQTTRDAARRATAGQALGVDLSSRMIEVARRLTATQGITNAAFEQTDAQVRTFDAASFDVAISRTGAMFFGDPVAAFTNVANALRPGGRLVLLTWQPLPQNEWIREISTALAAGRNLPTPPPDAPGPFSLSDSDRVRAVLTVAGFSDVKLTAQSEPLWFGEDADDAHRFIVGLLGWMLQGLDDTGRARALGDLRRTLADHDTDEGVLFQSAAWTIEAARS